MAYSQESIKELKKARRKKDPSPLVLQKQKGELVNLLKSQLPRREPNRVRVVTSLDRVLHQSCYTKPIKYYFTTGRKVICPRVVEKEPPPFFIDAHLQINEKVHLDRIQKLPNHLKPSRKDKPVIGLNDRLYISEKDPDYPLPKTITEISPDYFKISGRKIEESPFRKSVYVDRLKKTFLIRLQEGINEEANYVNEETKIRELSSLVYIRDNYIKTINLFNRFLLENVDELEAVSHTADLMAKLVELKSMQMESARNALGNIKDSLVSMDDTLQEMRISKIVLDEFAETKKVESRLAPDYWKMDYKKEKEKLEPIANKAADYVLQMFAYFKLEVPLREKDLEELVLRLANTIRNLGPPALYFRKTHEVPVALKEMEHSIVIAINTLNNACLRTEEVIKEDKKIQREQRKVLNMLRQEIDAIKNEFIGRLSQIMTIEEETGVIMSYWRAVATNPDLLQAFVQIKWLYDEFIGDKAPTKDIVEMLLVLTEKIINTQLDVNNLPREETDRIYNELKNKDDLVQQNALAARKEKTEAERMLKKMKKEYENRFRHPGLPQQKSMLRNEETEDEFEPTHSITPTHPISQEVLRNVLQIFQPNISQDAYIKFMESVDNLKKIEKELEVVKYPPAQSKFDKTDITKLPSSSFRGYCFKESFTDDSSDLPSSYIASAKATARECDTSDLSEAMASENLK